MKNFSGIIKLLSLAAVVAVIAGCASEPTKVESDLGIKGAPDWVNKGSNTLSTKDGRLFHGVGSASQMGDMALQKAVADDRKHPQHLINQFVFLQSHHRSHPDAEGNNWNAGEKRQLERRRKTFDDSLDHRFVRGFGKA